MRYCTFQITTIWTMMTMILIVSSMIALTVSAAIAIPTSTFVLVKATRLQRLRHKYALELFLAAMVLIICISQIPVQILTLISTLIGLRERYICQASYALESFAMNPYHVALAAIIFGRTQQLRKSKITLCKSRSQYLVIIFAIFTGVLNLLISLTSDFYEPTFDGYMNTTEVPEESQVITFVNTITLEPCIVTGPLPMLSVQVAIQFVLYLGYLVMIPFSWLSTIRYISKPRICPEAPKGLTVSDIRLNTLQVRGNGQRRDPCFSDSSSKASEIPTEMTVTDYEPSGDMGVKLCFVCRRNMQKFVREREGRLRRCASLTTHSLFDRTSTSSMSQRSFKYVYKPKPIPPLGRSRSHANMAEIYKPSSEASVYSSNSSLPSVQHQTSFDKPFKRNISQSDLDSDFDSVVMACKKEIEEESVKNESQYPSRGTSSPTDVNVSTSDVEFAEIIAACKREIAENEEKDVGARSSPPRFQFKVQRPSEPNQAVPRLRRSFSDAVLSTKINAVTQEVSVCRCQCLSLPKRQVRTSTQSQNEMKRGITVRIALSLGLCLFVLPYFVRAFVDLAGHREATGFQRHLFTAIVTLAFSLQMYMYIFYNRSIVKLLRKSGDSRIGVEGSRRSRDSRLQNPPINNISPRRIEVASHKAGSA